MSIVSVSVVGLGAVTAYGWGVEALWSGLESGVSAAQLHHDLGGRFPPACWFARVAEPPHEKAPSSNATRYARAFAAAVDEALVDARRGGWSPRGRVGIVHATTRGDLERWRARYLAWGSVDIRRSFVEQEWTKPAGDAMARHRFTGPALVVNAACSSGLHALAIAQRLISCGDASDVIVVSADVGFDGEDVLPFAALGPLVYDSPAQEACRPFQEGSRGFVLGEGAAALVLTSSDAPTSYVRVLSTTLGNDAYHPVAINPDRSEMLYLVDQALALAKVQHADVRYFSAHASGTEVCSAADCDVLAHLGPKAHAYGLKPLLGHCMGTAPLLDTVALAKAYRAGYLPVPKPVAKAHAQLARNPLTHGEGPTLQMGVGFGGNLSVAVFGPVGAGAEAMHTN